MEADIEQAFLACLSAASLWQATKYIDRTDPEPGASLKAMSAFCLSALSLKALLGERGERLHGPDFELWPDPGATGSPVWTEKTRTIGRRIEEFDSRGSVILVLGKAWAEYTQSPPENELARLKDTPSRVMDALQSEPSPPTQARLATVGRLPLVGLLDWSTFRYPREAIGRGLLAPRYLVPFKAGQKEMDWKSPDAVLHVHLRGSFEELPTVALARPDRSASRKKLRDPLVKFSKNHRSKLTVVYVGIPAGVECCGDRRDD